MKTYLVTFMNGGCTVAGSATVVARGEKSAIAAAKRQTGIKFFAYTHVMNKH